VELRFAADLRYVAQFNEVEIPISLNGRFTRAGMETLADAFHERHEALYGWSMPGTSLEVINLRLTALGRTDKPALQEVPAGGNDAGHARKRRRDVFFDGAFQEVDVYDGLALQPGNRLSGPAIVEQPTTTVVVPPGYSLSSDAYGNYVIRPEPADAGDTE
jgi:N-methylhydantoinase A